MSVRGLQRLRHVERGGDETIRAKTHERSIDPHVQGAGETSEHQRHRPAAFERILERRIKGKLAAQHRSAHPLRVSLLLLLAGLLLVAHPCAIQLQHARHRRSLEIALMGCALNQLGDRAVRARHLPDVGQHLERPA